MYIVTVIFLFSIVFCFDAAFLMFFSFYTFLFTYRQQNVYALTKYFPNSQFHPMPQHQQHRDRRTSRKFGARIFTVHRSELRTATILTASTAIALLKSESLGLPQA